VTRPARRERRAVSAAEERGTYLVLVAAVVLEP
jgi:hypothetical protein